MISLYLSFCFCSNSKVPGIQLLSETEDEYKDENEMNIKMNTTWEQSTEREVRPLERFHHYHVSQPSKI